MEYFNLILQFQRVYITGILLIMIGFFMLVLLNCTSYETNTETQTNLSIEGTIYNICNNLPLENIRVTLLSRDNNGFIGDTIVTQSDGSYHFDISTSNGFEYIQIHVNDRNPDDQYSFHTWLADSSYSAILFDVPSRIGNTKQDIYLPPRVPVWIKAISDSLKAPAEFIRFSIVELFQHVSHPDENHSTIYGMDSLQVKLGANLTHSLRVDYIRNNSQSSISKDFFVDCSDTNEVTVIY